MLIEQTLEKLTAMKLGAMAEAVQQQLGSDEATALSFEDRLGVLVDTEWTAREQRKLTRRLRAAKLRYAASLEAVDFTHPRRLKRQQVVSLGSGAWIADRHNLPNVFSEVISKALADHLGYAIFLGTIKGQNQLYRTYQAGQDDPAWFTVWQDVDGSLETETDATTTMLRQAVEDDRTLIAKGLMTQDEFDQEWYLSTAAAIKGAYYASLLTAARKEGRITRVPYDPALPVDTDWDLGISDKMSIWFSQSLRSGEVRLIDYYENSGEGIPHYAGVLKEKGYVYGEHWAPHDIRVRELGTGKSRLETAKNHGITFRIVRDIGVADGIDAARLILPRCWFDETKCRAGLEALTFYRKRYNERLQEFTDKPLHDWSSHGADAFRGLAVRHKPPKPTPAEEAPYRPPGRGSSDARDDRDGGNRGESDARITERGVVSRDR